MKNGQNTDLNNQNVQLKSQKRAKNELGFMQKIRKFQSGVFENAKNFCIWEFLAKNQKIPMCGF